MENVCIPSKHNTILRESMKVFILVLFYFYFIYIEI